MSALSLLPQNSQANLSGILAWREIDLSKFDSYFRNLFAEPNAGDLGANKYTCTARARGEENG